MLPVQRDRRDEDERGRRHRHADACRRSQQAEQRPRAICPRAFDCPIVESTVARVADGSPRLTQAVANGSSIARAQKVIHAPTSAIAKAGAPANRTIVAMITTFEPISPTATLLELLKSVLDWAMRSAAIDPSCATSWTRPKNSASGITSGRPLNELVTWKPHSRSKDSDDAPISSGV